MRSFVFFLCVAMIACQRPETHPTVVIGGGLMGSSAAWHLSKNGDPVLLLEQQDESYDHGSSQGKSRIARSLGPDRDIWGWLHDGTVLEVKELVHYLNNKGINDLSIDDIYTTSPVSYVRHIKQLPRLEALMYDGQPDPYQFARSPEDADRLFGMNIPDSVIVMREYLPYSGTINPETLIKACHAAIRQSGNEVRYKTRVDQLTKSSDQFRIDYTDLTTQKKGTLYASKVISAAGPWTGPLLKQVAPYMDSLLNPQRVFLAYLKISDKKYQTLSAEQKDKIKEGYPLINSSLGTRLGSNFSMIDRYVNDMPVIKIGGHFQRSEISDLSSIWEQSLSDEEIQWSISRVHQYLNYLNLPIALSDIEVVDTYSCVYTLTQNEVPYITHAVHPDGTRHDDLVIMAGLSGVGGKGSLMYGKMAADLINTIEPQLEMDVLVADKMGIERLTADVGLD